MTKRLSAAPATQYAGAPAAQAKAKPQAEPQKLTRAGKPWDMKAALKAIGEKHGETLRALAK